MRKLLLILILIIPIYKTLSEPKIGIEEKLGSYIPLDISFIDESGKEVILKDIIKKPTVFSFVYYKCPGICSPLLTELTNTISRSDLQLGKDYQALTISMDETEKSKDAAEKKNTLLSLSEKELPMDSWSFLTGSKENIKKIADASGYYFKRNGKDFLHTGVFIFISADGKICRYLYPDYSRKGGFSILPFDFKMAINEATQGTPLKTMSKLVQYCFSYDPQGRTYVLNLTRIFGAGILLFLIVFVVLILKKPGKKIIKGA